MTTVADSSLIVAALTDSGYEGRWEESVIAQESLASPELVMVESSNILRRLELAGKIPRLQADAAHEFLRCIEIELFPFAPFARRVWELRYTLTSYDAWYVALAEALDCPMATLDRRLSRAGGPSCQFITPT